MLGSLSKNTCSPCFQDMQHILLRHDYICGLIRGEAFKYISGTSFNPNDSIVADQEH